MGNWIENGQFTRYLSEERLEWLRAQLSQEGYRIFDLDGIANESDFLRVIKDRLPLNPPIYSGNWNAISDSLFEGLIDLPEKKIAIVWNRAHTLMNSDLENFTLAVLVFSEVAALIPKYSEKTFRTFLVDDGQYFQSQDLSMICLSSIDTEC